MSKGNIPAKAIFEQMQYSSEGGIPVKTVFERGQYFSKGGIAVKMVFQLINSELAVYITVRDSR